MREFCRHKNKAAQKNKFMIVKKNTKNIARYVDKYIECELKL